MKNQQAAIKVYLSRIGRRGAEVANSRRSPEERSRIGRHAVTIWWERYKKAKKKLESREP